MIRSATGLAVTLTAVRLKEHLSVAGERRELLRDRDLSRLISSARSS